MLNLLSVTFSRALRKPGLTLVMAFVLAILLSGCQSEPVITSKESRDREYLKSFVNEFGSLPSSEKVFDVTRSTLTVISQRSNPVKVYYTDENGNRVLVGDLIIPAGREEIPFILPSGIDRLIVETGEGEFPARIGSELNLDTAVASKASRADEVEQFRSTVAARRMRFFPEDVMPAYWSKFPVIDAQNNIASLNMDSDSNLKFWGSFEFTKGKWMLYPVYYRVNTTTSYTNLGDWDYTTLQVNDKILDYEYFKVKNDMNPKIPFDLWESDRYTKESDYDEIKNYYIYYGPGRNPSRYNTSYEYTNRLVQTHGVCMPSNWKPTIVFQKADGSNQKIVQTTAITEMGNWTTRFWNVTMDFPYKAYQHIVVYTASEPVTYYVPTDNNCPNPPEDIYPWVDNGSPTEWTKRTVNNPIFIGVNRPPREIYSTPAGYGAEYGLYPDFNDIVYLLVPEEGESECSFTSSGATVSTDTSYLLAAEDLGGSLDWDFNDAVFRVSFVTKTASTIMESYCKSVIKKNFDEIDQGYMPQPWRRYDGDGYFIGNDEKATSYFYEATVTPLAAGGTLPIYIAYQGKVVKYYDKIKELFDSYKPSTTFNDVAWSMFYFNNMSPDNWEDGIHIVGEELHNWLGEPDPTKQVNVGAKRDHTAPYKVSFYVKDSPREYDNLNWSEAGAGHLMRFSVIVDKEKTLDIPRPEEAKTSKTVYDNALTLFTPNGQTYEVGGFSQDKNDTAPQMLRIDRYWAREGVNIKDAFNKGNDGAGKSLVEKWLEGGTSPWGKYFDELITK